MADEKKKDIMDYANTGAGIGSSVGGLFGGIGSLLGLGGEGGEDEQSQIVDIWNKLEESDWDYTALTAPELKVFAQAAPEVYEAVVPDKVKEIVANPALEAAQYQSLGQLQQVAKEGLPLVDRIAAQEAQQSVAKEADRAQEQVIRNLAARGRLGGGTELQARLAAGQQSATTANQLGTDLAKEQLLRKLSAGQAAGELSGQMQSADTARQAQNQQMWSNYNNLVAQMRTNAAQNAAQSRQAASDYNVQTKQKVGEANELAKYTTALENLNRKNQLKGQTFNQQLAKTQGQAGALGGLGAYKDQQQQSKIAAISGIGSGLGSIGGAAVGAGLF